MIRRRFIDLPHGQVHVRQTGNSDKPTLAMFHQSPSSSVMFEPLMLALADDFHMIAPDTPGFGDSDAIDDFDIPKCANIMRSLMDALDVSSAHLFGHHTGASLAVALAARDPKRFQSLALCGPPLLTDAQKKSLPGMAIYEPDQSDGSHLVRLWARFAKKEKDVPTEIIQRELMLALKAGINNVEAYRAVAAYDFEKDIGRLSCPVLLFAGEHDSLRSCLDRTEAAVRDGLLHVLEGAGTYACEREPSHVAALIKFFHERFDDGS